LPSKTILKSILATFKQFGSAGSRDGSGFMILNDGSEKKDRIRNTGYSKKKLSEEGTPQRSTANKLQFMYKKIYPSLTPKYQLNISKYSYNILSGIMILSREVCSLSAVCIGSNIFPQGIMKLQYSSYRGDLISD
jgi:hypothetical protein